MRHTQIRKRELLREGRRLRQSRAAGNPLPLREVPFAQMPPYAPAPAANEGEIQPGGKSRTRQRKSASHPFLSRLGAQLRRQTARDARTQIFHKLFFGQVLCV